MYHSLRISPRDMQLQEQGKKQTSENFRYDSNPNAVPLLTEECEGGRQETYKAHKNVHFEATPNVFHLRTSSNSSEKRKDCTMISLPLLTCGKKGGADLPSKRIPEAPIQMTPVEECLKLSRSSVTRTQSKSTMGRTDCGGHDSSGSSAKLQTTDTDTDMVVYHNLGSLSHSRNPSGSEGVEEELGSEEEVELTLKLECDSSDADADSFYGPDLANFGELTLSMLEEAEEDDLGLQFDHSGLVKASRLQRKFGHDVANELTQTLQRSTTSTTSDGTNRSPRIHLRELLKAGVGRVYGKIVEPGSIHRGKKFYFSRR